MHPGFCKLCGCETHEIIKQHPAGTPLAGRPTKIGKVLQGVVKAHFLLTNGSWATLQVHDHCVDLVTPEELPTLWQRCLETARFEQDNRALLGAEPLNPKQRQAVEAHLVQLASVAMLGISCVEEV